MKTAEEIITEAEIEKVFGHANFGDQPKRDVLKYSLLKYACGYSTGHTAFCICRELGLIKDNRRRHNSASLTKKGKEYLFFSLYSGHSY